MINQLRIITVQEQEQDSILMFSAKAAKIGQFQIKLQNAEAVAKLLASVIYYVQVAP